MSRRTVRVTLADTEIAVVLACDGTTTTASLLDRLAGHLKVGADRDRGLRFWRRLTVQDRDVRRSKCMQRHLYIAIDPKGTTLTFQNQVRLAPRPTLLCFTRQLR